MKEKDAFEMQYYGELIALRKHSPYSTENLHRKMAFGLLVKRSKVFFWAD